MLLRFVDDPLLSATRALLRITYWLSFGFAALGLAIVILGLVLGLTSDNFTSFGTHTHFRLQDIWMFVAVPPVLGLLGWFVRLLAQIVGTVAAGDPFIGVNAERLNRMAWLMLALKMLVLTQNAVMLAILRLPHPPFDFPNPSLLFPLTLFILARVFHQGAAMRDDLEGTV